MKARKIFALSILTASIALAAGCSSDDDDETDPVTTPTEPTAPMTGGPGTEGPGTEGPGTDEPVEVVDTSTNMGASVLDVARGTDGDDEDLEIDADSGVADLSTLVSLVGNYPDLVNLLDDETAMLTVFAPTNAAFEAAIAAGLDANDADAVRRALEYHVIPSNIDATAAMTMLDTDLATAAEGGTVQIRQGADANLIVVDSAGVEVSLDMAVSASNGNATVYIVDTVLTAPAAAVVEPMEPVEGEGGATDPVTGPVAAAGSPFAAIDADGSLAGFEALVRASGFDQSLADAANNTFLTFAPTDAALDAAVTTAAAYIVTSLGAPTTAEPAAGTYMGTGEEAVTFEVTGSAETLMVNGLPASFVTSGDGGALVKFGE